MQGRLYLFQHHVCFYSNLFGFIKSKVIPLQVYIACCSATPFHALTLTEIYM